MSRGTEYGVKGDMLGEPSAVVEIDRRPMLPSIVDETPSANCGFGVKSEATPSLSWSATEAFIVCKTSRSGVCDHPVPLLMMRTAPVCFGVRKSMLPSPSKSPGTESEDRFLNLNVFEFNCRCWGS